MASESRKHQLIDDDAIAEWMKIENDPEQFGMWLVRCQTRETQLSRWVGWKLMEQLDNIRSSSPMLFTQMPFLATILSSIMVNMFWRGMYFGERRYYLESADMFDRPGEAPDPMSSDPIIHKEEKKDPPPFGPDSFA